jgi:Zn finger protein HypA/HybF involved in hydrogenase expression
VVSRENMGRCACNECGHEDDILSFSISPEAREKYGVIPASIEELGRSRAEVWCDDCNEPGQEEVIGDQYLRRASVCPRCNQVLDVGGVNRFDFVVVDGVDLQVVEFVSEVLVKVYDRTAPSNPHRIINISAAALDRLEGVTAWYVIPECWCGSGPAIASSNDGDAVCEQCYEEEQAVVAEGLRQLDYAFSRSCDRGM